MTLLDELFKNQDLTYRAFQSSLTPALNPECMIGVRTPVLRKLAKEMDEKEKFLASLPHSYFEENQVHAFIISGMKDFEACINALEAFLPYVDNWATCDQMSPRVFKKHKSELLPYIKKWLESGKTYTVRFGIKALMDHFLDSDFDLCFPALVSSVKSDQYYVKMMAAWYFATALGKQYEAVLPFLEDQRLDRWTHNKSIQKAVESFRITEEHKTYLKSLRIR